MINTVSRRAIPDFRALVNCNTAVKRCLFGEPDHKLVREELDKELKSIRRNDAQRWNFDFRAEEPLPGNFEWEKISTHVVAQTRSAAISSPAEDKFRIMSSTASSSAASSTSSSTDGEPMIVPLTPCLSKPEVRQMKTRSCAQNTTSQSSITKYFKVSKRVTRSSLEKSRNEKSPTTRSTRRNLYSKVC